MQCGGSSQLRGFQVDLMHENETLGTPNPVTSSTFKTAKFIVDIPIRLDDRQLLLWAPGKKIRIHGSHMSLPNFRSWTKSQTSGMSRLTRAMTGTKFARWPASRTACSWER